MQYPDPAPTSVKTQALIVTAALTLLFASPIIRTAKRLFRRLFNRRGDPQA